MRNATTLIFSLFISFHIYSFQKENKPEKNQSEIQLENVESFILHEKNTDTINSFLLKTLENNPGLTLKYYKLYLERGLKEKNDQILFTCYYYLGDISDRKGDYINSIKYSKLASDIAEKLNNDSYKLSSYTLSGTSYFNIRYYNNAIIQFQKAHTIAKRLGIKEKEISSRLNINNCWVRIDRYKEALQSFEVIIELLKNKKYHGSNYYSNFFSTHIGAGVCNFKLGKYDKAISYYNVGLELSKKLHLKEIEATFHNTIGEAYIAKKKYSDAIRHLKTAKSLVDENNKIFDQNLFTTNFHLATLYFQNEKYKTALEVLQESFKTIDSSNEKQVEKIVKMYELAQLCAEKLSDQESQLYYSMAYKKINDIRHNDDLMTRDKLYDYDLIELKEEKQQLISKNFIYISCLLVAVFIIILLLFYHFKKQQKNKVLFERLQITAEEIHNKSVPSVKKEFITDKKANEIFEKLLSLEETNFFLSEDCNLYNTAKKMDTNTSYLSKIMNDYREQSFNDYINQLRIKYCCEQLKTSQKLKSYTIKGIANELGYKSVNTFASAFKKHTGLTHSYYIKQMLLSSEKKEASN